MSHVFQFFQEFLVLVRMCAVRERAIDVCALLPNFFSLLRKMYKTIFLMQNFVNGFAPFRFNVTWEGSEGLRLFVNALDLIALKLTTHEF